MRRFNTIAIAIALNTVACGGKSDKDQHAVDPRPVPAPVRASGQQDAPAPSVAEGQPGSVALVEVANPPGTEHRKVFRGITFVTNSERLTVSYSGSDVYSLFAGRQVRFEGKLYDPEGQALAGPHLRPGRVVLVDPTGEDLYLSISAPQSVCGQIVTGLHPENTKLGGERFHRFETGGKTHHPFTQQMPEPGHYQVIMRHLEVNTEFAPVIAVAMAIPMAPVWLDHMKAVGSCDE